MKRLIPLLIAIFATTLSGCAMEPWVKPYERAALADEVMSNERNPAAAEYMDHVREVREGSHGATGGAGGGCGCN